MDTEHGLHLAGYDITIHINDMTHNFKSSRIRCCNPKELMGSMDRLHSLHLAGYSFAIHHQANMANDGFKRHNLGMGVNFHVLIFQVYSNEGRCELKKKMLVH